MRRTGGEDETITRMKAKERDGRNEGEQDAERLES